ncbi:hypothetical protein AAMO2058_001534500 [Amorphochlora amoebiformis]
MSDKKGLRSLLDRSTFGRLIFGTGTTTTGESQATNGGGNADVTSSTAELSKIPRQKSNPRRDQAMRQRADAALRATLAAELGEARTFITSHLRTHETFYDLLRQSEDHLIKTYELLITHKAEKTSGTQDKLLQGDIEELKTTLCSLIELTSQVKEKLKIRIATLRSRQDVLNALIGRKADLERTVGTRVAGYLSNCTFSSIQSRETYDNFEFQTMLLRARKRFQETQKSNGAQQKRRQRRLHREKAGGIWLGGPSGFRAKAEHKPETEADFVSRLIHQVGVIVKQWTATIDTILGRLRSSRQNRGSRIMPSSSKLPRSKVGIVVGSNQKQAQDEKQSQKQNQTQNYTSRGTGKGDSVRSGSVAQPKPSNLNGAKGLGAATEDNPESMVHGLQERLRHLQLQHDRAVVEMKQEFARQLDEMRERSTHAAALASEKHNYETSKLDAEIHMLRTQVEAATAVQGSLEEQNLQVRGILGSLRERVGVDVQSLKDKHAKEIDKERRRHRREMEKLIAKEVQARAEAVESVQKALMKKEKELERVKVLSQDAKKAHKEKEQGLHNDIQRVLSMRDQKTMEAETDLKERIKELTKKFQQQDANHKSEVNELKCEIARIQKEAKSCSTELLEDNNAYRNAYDAAREYGRNVSQANTLLHAHSVDVFQTKVTEVRSLEIKNLNSRAKQLDQKLKAMKDETNRLFQDKIKKFYTVVEKRRSVQAENLRKQEEARLRAEEALKETEKLQKDTKEKQTSKKSSPCETPQGRRWTSIFRERVISEGGSFKTDSNQPSFKPKQQVRTRYGSGSVVVVSQVDSIVKVNLNFAVGYFHATALDAINNTQNNLEKEASESGGGGSGAMTSFGNWFRRKTSTFMSKKDRSPANSSTSSPKSTSLNTASLGGNGQSSNSVSKRSSSNIHQKVEEVKICFERKSLGLTCTGNLVTSIKPGGQAEKLGVIIGWRILRVDGKSVDSMVYISLIC